MPKFKGDLNQWTSFHDLFEDNVDANPQLQPSQKLHYLKALLEGEPARLIRNLEPTNANYAIAIKILKDRYAQNRMLASHHLRALANTSALVDESYGNVSRFLATATEHTLALRRTGSPEYSWEHVVALQLADKLPPHTRSQFERSVEKDTLPSMEDLLKFLRQLLQSQQWEVDNTRTVARRAAIAPRPQMNRTSFACTTSGGQCLACPEQHRTHTCEAFRQLFPTERRRLVARHSACHNCLSRSHTARSCTSRYLCRTCGEKHHSMLHEAFARATTTPSPTSPRRLTANQTTAEPPRSDQSESACFSSSSTAQIVMGTAVVQIQARSGSWEPARAFLDPGSDRSYVTTSLAKRLQLETALPSAFGGLPGSRSPPVEAAYACNSDRDSHPINSTPRGPW